jgi:hypothetical protein
MLIVLKFFFIALAAATLLLLVSLVWRSKRRLDRQVAEWKRTQEDSGRAAVNPWMALAELYAEDARKDRETKQEQGSKKAG